MSTSSFLLFIYANYAGSSRIRSQFDKEHPEWADAADNIEKFVSKAEGENVIVIKNPIDLKKSEKLPQVFIVVSTFFGRRQFDQHIYNTFRFQDYKGRMNLFVAEQEEPADKKTIPSLFATLEDPRVSMEVYKKPKGEAFKLGKKRNWAIERIKNSYIKQDEDHVILIFMDDDDFYNPSYVSVMVNALEESPENKFVKYRSWNFVRKTKNNTETKHFAPNESDVRGVYGWGFVYAMKLIPGEIHAYYGEYESFGEDLIYVEDFLRKRIGKIVLLDDGKTENIMVVKRVDISGQGNLSDIPPGDWKTIALKSSFFDDACDVLKRKLAHECKMWYQKEIKTMGVQRRALRRM